MLGEECLVGGALWLGQEAGLDDVEDVLEMVKDAELASDVLGMAARAVGQDQLAAGQSRDRSAKIGSPLRTSSPSFGTIRSMTARFGSESPL